MALLQDRIALMVRLGDFLAGNHEEWQSAIEAAHAQNGWFDRQNVEQAVANIRKAFLQETLLRNWIATYPVLEKEGADAGQPLIGIVMAGNIPLVGFHDFLCAYIAGFPMKIKLSSRDQVLWNAIFRKLQEWDVKFRSQVQVAEMLKDCDAYIATGSNNTARYFEFYFQKYPNIIRRNRTSAAILEGTESAEQISGLISDITACYGLGCRNVTQIFIPRNYNLTSLLQALESTDPLLDNHKYKNNFDYQLALLILNKQQYLTNNIQLFTENEQPFAAISVVHYQYFTDKDKLKQQLLADERYQCIVGAGAGLTPFGLAQQPALSDYADGIDTMDFLSALKKF